MQTAYLQLLGSGPVALFVHALIGNEYPQIIPFAPISNVTLSFSHNRSYMIVCDYV